MTYEPCPLHSFSKKPTRLSILSVALEDAQLDAQRASAQANLASPMLANIFGRGRQRKAKTKTRHAKTTEVAEAAEENAAKKAKKKQIKIRNSEASEAKFAEAQDLARHKRADRAWL